MHHDLVEVVRAVLDRGGDADEAARELLARTLSPIAAIKALMDATGMRLAEAKPVVHRSLTPATQKEAESLWDELEDALRELADGRGEDQQRLGWTQVSQHRSR